MAKKVKAIPDGYHSVTAALIVKGAAEAIAFYKKAFGAKELLRIAGPGGAIMHAELKIGDSMVMMGEESPAMGNMSPPTLGGSPVSFFVYVDDVNAQFKRAVKAGAIVKSQPTEMFWGDRVGRVQDPFGHTWSLAQHTRNLSDAQIKKGMDAAMAQMGKKK